MTEHNAPIEESKRGGEPSGEPRSAETPSDGHATGTGKVPSPAVNRNPARMLAGDEVHVILRCLAYPVPWRVARQTAPALCRVIRAYREPTAERKKRSTCGEAATKRAADIFGRRAFDGKRARREHPKQ